MSHQFGSSAKSTKKKNYQPIDCDYIQVEPKNYLQFVCTPFQISAVLKIIITDEAHNFSTFRFTIKATNKTDYIVTDPTGIVRANQSILVYFYMKQSAALNKNLKDKFLLEICENYGNHVQKVVFSRKLAIQIQSALQFKNEEVNSQNNLNVQNVGNTMSKMLSGYVSASDFPKENHQRYLQSTIGKSEIKNIANKKNFQQLTPLQTARSILKKDVQLPLSFRNKDEIITDEQKQFRSARINPDEAQSLSMSQSNIRDSKTGSKHSLHNPLTLSCDPTRLQRLTLLEQNLKTQLNQVIQEIQKKRRKVLIMQNDNKYIQARARFRIYATVFMVILCLFGGMFIKSLNLDQKVINVYEKTKTGVNHILSKEQMMEGNTTNL